MDKEKPKTPDRSSISAESPTSENRLLISTYLEELERLKNEDSAERAQLYGKAAELGLRIIRGNN